MYQITLSIPAGPGLSLDVTRSMEATFYQSSHDLTQQNCLHQHQPTTPPNIIKSYPSRRYTV